MSVISWIKKQSPLAASVATVIAAIAAVVGVVIGLKQFTVAADQVEAISEHDAVRLTFDLAEKLRSGTNGAILAAINEDYPPRLLKEHGGRFSGGDLDTYLVEYELLQDAYEKGQISKDLIDDGFSFEIERAYLDPEIKQFIEEARHADGDPGLYGGFTDLAASLLKEDQHPPSYNLDAKRWRP